MRKTFLSPSFFQLRGITISALIFLIGFSVISTIPNHPAFWPYPSTDSGVFLYLGSQILQGKIPYVDVWDNKPPLIYFINALGLLFGGGHIGVWVIEVAARSVAGGLCFVVLRRVFGQVTAFVTTFSVIATLVLMTYGGNHPSHYAVPLQFGALLLFSISLQRKNHVLVLMFGIGLLGGAAFLLRQTNVGLWVGIGLYEIIANRRNLGRVVVTTLALGAGIITVFFPIGLYLLKNDALAEFWRASFAYNMSRPQTMNFMTTIINFVVGGISGFLRILIVPTGLSLTALAGMLSLALERTGIDADGYRGNFVVACTLGLLADTIMSGVIGGQPQYYVPLVATCSVLTGQFVYSILMIKPMKFLIVRLRRFISAKWWFAAASSAVVLVVMSLLTVIGGQYLLNNRMEKISYATSYNTMQYVAEMTNADAYIMLWGNEVGTFFYTQRFSPTRFVAFEPLTRTATSPYIETGAEELLQGILERPPEIIIDTAITNLSYPPLDAGMRQPWIATHFEIPYLEPLYTFVATHYEIATRIEPGGWTVYRLIAAQDSLPPG